MINNPTLVRYLAKLFSKYFILTSLGVIVILLIANIFDILHKFKSFNITLSVFWKLIIFKIPYIFDEVTGLISFIAMLLFIYRMLRGNELVIIISCGIPIWKILLIPLITSFIWGLSVLAVLTPCSAQGLKMYRNLEAKITGFNRQSVSISSEGIFFFELHENTHRITHAQSIDTANNELKNITLLIVDDNNSFLERIDAPSAILADGALKLNMPRITTDTTTSLSDDLTLTTNISIASLIARSLPPEMITIWKLHNHIQTFLKSGLPAVNYQIYFYKQLLKPLKMMTMILPACWFINLDTRSNRAIKMLFLGLITGFIIYFLAEIITRLLTFNGVSPLFAALLPLLIIILVSNFVILHFQEA